MLLEAKCAEAAFCACATSQQAKFAGPKDELRLTSLFLLSEALMLRWMRPNRLETVQEEAGAFDFATKLRTIPRRAYDVAKTTDFVSKYH